MTRKRYRKLLTAWAHEFCRYYNMPKGSAGQLIRWCNRKASLTGIDFTSYNEVWRYWIDSKAFRDMNYKAE